MANDQTYSPAAGAYAQALIDLAEQAGLGDEMAGNLAALAKLVREDATLRALFRDPTIRKEERWGVIERTFKGRAPNLFVNFLGVVTDKDRLGLIPQISDAYATMLDQKRNRVRVTVTVSQKLDESQLAQVQQRVSAALAKNAVVEEKIDDSIIGGLVVHVEGKIIDGSVKTQLEAMRKQLLAAGHGR